jgi:hypothetical protein
MIDVIKIWKEKDKIFEGIVNNIFKKADVEHIAAKRMEICATCPDIDREGIKCMVPNTNPCCGVCGCSLNLKTRSLSSACDNGRWLAVLTQQEEAALDQYLAINEAKQRSDETDIRTGDSHLQNERE